MVISLDASDEFLKNRVMNLPESIVAGTHNTEEGLLRRLAEFRAVNTEDETVLNYFDELEVHPDHIGITHYYCLLYITALYLNVPLLHIGGCTPFLRLV